MRLGDYPEIWLVDFEFGGATGEHPEPRCLVAREYHTGRLIRCCQDELHRLSKPPYPTGCGSLFVAYYASAELGCHLALDWPMPERILDLYAEFRCKTSGLPTTCGNGLLGALAHHGLPALAAAEKTSMRELSLRGGPYSDDERRRLLDYCQEDVDALAKLLPAMADDIDLPRALMRGRYMAAVARVERSGVPIDVDIWQALREHWTDIQADLVRQVDSDYGVYHDETFKRAAFAEYLRRNDIPWPRLDSGQLQLDDKTFETMAKAYPQLGPLRELRKTMGQLRLNSLAVGPDGRNRCLLSPFASKTGRNQPSSTKFVFGLPAWCRALIKPAPGMALAYVDWSQQEFGIAAALSGDQAMQSAYRSGDPYMNFAIQAGAAPPTATKATHRDIREQFKVCAGFGVLYGMSAQTLARSMAQPEAKARQVLRAHKDAFPQFWKWSRAAMDHAALRGSLRSVFGWRVHVGPDTKPRTLMNFPMQANGAEMMRLACCLMTERGINVCAPVHDAVLVEARADRIDGVVEAARAAMEEASAVVLDGFRLRTDVQVIRHPDRYMDGRGLALWGKVTGILQEIRVKSCCAHAHPVVAPAQQDLLRPRTPALSYVL